MNYSKWDKIADSDEENESKQRKTDSIEEEKLICRREMQAEIDMWLRRQINRLPRDGETSSRKPTMPEYSSATKVPPTPIRQVTKGEREVLAMLIAVSHFEEGQTNLDRHPAMLDLVRHHRWLEEDPGCLELLCRIHNHVMKEGDEYGGGGRGRGNDDPESHRMRNMVLSAINTIAAPKRAKCPGGLLELFTVICTPETEAARELRLKWQRKEFGKDALFDSLFPDLRAYADEKMEDGLGSDFWIIVVLGLLAIVGIVAFILLYYHNVAATGPRSNVAATAANISSVAEAAVAATTGAATTSPLPAALDSIAATAAAATSGPNAPAPDASRAPVAPAPAPNAVKTACVDTSDSCAYWAEIGECTNNADFMMANCRLSCRVCQVSAPPAPPPALNPKGDQRGAEL